MSTKVLTLCNGCRTCLHYCTLKVRQWQVLGASHYPDFLQTANFRQGMTIVFLFLIVAIASMMGSSKLIESLIRGHVHDVIVNDLYDYSVKSSLKSTPLMLAQIGRESLEHSDNLAQVLLINPQGEIIYHSMTLSQQHTGSCGMEVACLKKIIQQDDHDNLVGLSVLLDDGGILFRGYHILPMLERVKTIPLVAGAGVFIVLLICLYVSRQFSLRSLHIAREIREALNRYSSGDKHVRMPCSAYRNDFDALSTDINQNLERIERLMEQVRSNAGHIAHELRTPLTHLHNRLYSLSEREDLTNQSRIEIDSAVNEVQTILTLFRNVMRISEIESGRCIHQLSDCSAHELLQDVAEYYQPLAESRSCTLIIEPKTDIQMFIDRSLVFQALANLIENALKYAADGRVITLGYRFYHGWLTLYVADQGPGIPDDLQSKAIEPFERLDKRYSSNGYGLGLSLVNAITELHGGKIKFENTHPGLCVYLCLNRCQ